ncbi:putative pentatricopeptide repeat-containing protein [Platanthera guangdongensis]|uniref:Pentatricopeptide repeat-containing protein n=1 Tax=Platanthera guangdongensis TaxID=2320717 RepID=A0ABR2MGM9_9ASPA
MFSLGTQIHAMIMKSKHSFDTVVCNSLISMYGSCSIESVGYADKVLYSTPVKNTITWNSIISIHSQKGDIVSSFNFFSRMQEGEFWRLQTERVYIRAMVSAFARYGLFDTGREVFLELDHRNSVSVNGLMLGLIKQNCGQEAMEVFREVGNLVSQDCDSSKCNGGIRWLRGREEKRE